MSEPTDEELNVIAMRAYMTAPLTEGITIVASQSRIRAAFAAVAPVLRRRALLRCAGILDRLRERRAAAKVREWADMEDDTYRAPESAAPKGTP